jgi:benzil reductase ((S)-benzoin forming)
MNSFIRSYQQESFTKIILNISSGAGRHPFESWGLYCSSKASLDMLSRVIEAEQNLLPIGKRVRVFSVAPGIVDTEMQSEIRKTSVAQFPKLETFIDYYKNKQLADPKEVARKLITILLHPDEFHEVIMDVRSF